MNLKLSDIPIIGMGPGSQPDEEDGSALDYMAMPQAMSFFQPMSLPEQEDLQAYPQVLSLLAQLQDLLAEQAQYPEQAYELSLAQVSAAEKRLLAQILSEGEVSILFNTADGGHQEIQETSLPGVWWHRSLDANQQPQAEKLEISDFPRFIRQATFAQAQPTLVLPAKDSDSLPEGLVNAPWLLAELQEQQQNNHQGHVINLTLLPLNDADLQFLATELGTGKTAILSRGYGNCRITATAITNIWWVQYYNSTDTLILNTLEVVEVPLVTCASSEDLADSALRLQEIREALA